MRIAERGTTDRGLMEAGPCRPADIRLRLAAALRLELFDDAFERFDDLGLVHARLGEAEAQIECLRLWLERKDERLRPSRLALGGLGAQVLARGPAALSNLLHEGQHL